MVTSDGKERENHEYLHRVLKFPFKIIVKVDDIVDYISLYTVATMMAIPTSLS